MQRLNELGDYLSQRLGEPVTWSQTIRYAIREASISTGLRESIDGDSEGIKRISRPPMTRTEEFLRATQQRKQRS